MSGPNPGSKGRSKGIGLPGDTMIIVFKKSCRRQEDGPRSSSSYL